MMRMRALYERKNIKFKKRNYLIVSEEKSLEIRFKFFGVDLQNMET